MAPPERVGETNADTRHTRELHPIDVGLVRHRQVHLPEPQLTFPGEMRITDQHSATLTAPLRSDRPRIGADLRAEIGEPGGPKTTRSRRRVRIGIVLDVT